MNNTKIELGSTYEDRISGFRGVAVGFCAYLTGCNQALLQPKSDDNAKRPDSEWFDEQRLSAVSSQARVVLDNSTTPGCDRAAPKR